MVYPKSFSTPLSSTLLSKDLKEGCEILGLKFAMDGADLSYMQKSNIFGSGYPYSVEGKLTCIVRPVVVVASLSKTSWFAFALLCGIRIFLFSCPQPFFNSGRGIRGFFLFDEWMLLICIATYLSEPFKGIGSLKRGEFVFKEGISMGIFEESFLLLLLNEALVLHVRCIKYIFLSF